MVRKCLLGKVENDLENAACIKPFSECNFIITVIFSMHTLVVNLMHSSRHILAGSERTVRYF